MSTNHSSSNGNLPVNNDVSFEEKDISISSVVWSLFYLAVTVFVSLAICVYFFKFSTGFIAGSDLPRPVVRQQIVASHRTTVHGVAAAGSSRPLYNYVPPARAVQRVVAPVVVTQAPPPAPGQVLNLSGQFQCVEGCAGGQPGPVFVTQNRWDLNLVNELGQPTRAWVDWPGHIWTESWNEGAVYSPDGMTIQFDNGTVWRRNIELLVLPSAFPQGR